MIDNITPEQCTGCQMCIDVCPFKAITLKANTEGFIYPSISEEKCTKCKICEERCPALNHEVINPNKGFQVYACKASNEKIRLNSSSGGMFNLLATHYISLGGYIAGVVYSIDMKAKHDLICDADGVSRQMKSKYVQSDADHIYRKVEDKLLEEKYVMFTGTPCQVSALHNYLNKDYPKLMCVDIICCGVASPLAFQKYKESIAHKYHLSISKISFKDKTYGWHKYSTKISFEGGRILVRRANDDPYMKAYMQGLIHRLSCHSCIYKTIPHISDITIGDFWGIERVAPEFDDDKGVSAVIINTEKGSLLFQSISKQITSIECDHKSVLEGNPRLTTSHPRNAQREKFLNDILHKRFDLVLKRFLYHQLATRIKNRVCRRL